MSIEELAKKIYETEFIGFDCQTGPLTTNVNIKDLLKISKNIIETLKKIDEEFKNLLIASDDEIIKEAREIYDMSLVINIYGDILICYSQ